MTEIPENLQPKNSGEALPELSARRVWYRTFFDQGITLYEKGEYEDAIPVLRRAADLEQTPSALALLGKALSEEAWRKISGSSASDEEEQFMEAVTYLKKSLAALPSQFGLNARIGKIYFELGDYSKAAIYFQNEYELASNHRKRPEEFRLYYGIARALAQSWRKTGMLENMKKAEGLLCAVSLEACTQGHDGDAEIFEREFYYMRRDIDSHPDNKPPPLPPSPAGT
jgi:tetratricopeptide (TPR) repeat protein